MNDYRQIRCEFAPCSETVTDIAAALLADVGFESFVPDGAGLTAYIKEELYQDGMTEQVLADFPIENVECKLAESVKVEGRDWNSEWERNYFQPLVIDDSCVIHASFHKGYPKCKHDIVIDPKMAFGTGHHATTSLIIRQILSSDLHGKRVMDMGTGTGILAILCAMTGAGHVEAIEIDPFAHANALENVSANGHPEICITLGDASALPPSPSYDLLIANINRNIVTADLPRYAAALKPGGEMLLSGFYVDDCPLVEAISTREGLKLKGLTEDHNWACLRLVKGTD